MNTKQENSHKDLQTLSQGNGTNQKFMCRKVEIVLPRSFINDKHIDDCLIYKTSFCHIDYHQKTLVNISGEFLILYTCNNKKQGKKRFPFTCTFLCDFFPYNIKIPSPAIMDFCGQEINIYQTIVIHQGEAI